jgi:sulfatase modifying factor 1
MRLVERDHPDVVDHECTDARGKHCFAYAPGVSAPSGPLDRVRVCMDIFEAPNVRSARPIVMRSGVEAAEWCGRRDKRLCSEGEWEAACEGDELRPWVYGWTASGAACNSGKTWRAFDEAALASGGARAQAEATRLWQGEPSGSRPQCVSQDGVYDLVGNVEEWVSSRPGRRWPSALMGGFWAKPWTGCRGTNDAHDPSFTFYEVGFRCCASPR